MATTLSSTEREVLARLLGAEPKVTVAQRLEGSSHQLLAFVAAGDPLIARWPKVTRSEHAWWQELSVHQLAAQHGLTPQILALNASTQSTLLPKAKPLQFGLTGIARLLKQCHQLPKVSHKLDIAHAFTFWFESCKPEQQPWSTQANQQKAEHAARKFAEFDTCLVQSHGDCVASNILQIHNRAVFIDWEYHCLAPCWWDLAIYSESQHLNTEASNTLLQSYCQTEPLLDAHSQLEAFRGIYADLAILWHCATMRSPNHYQTP
jgi:thiamine kinase-like enzyme